MTMPLIIVMDNVVYSSKCNNGQCVYLTIKQR